MTGICKDELYSYYTTIKFVHTEGIFYRASCLPSYTELLELRAKGSGIKWPLFALTLIIDPGTVPAGTLT